METIEQENRLLKRQLLSQDAESTKQRALMLMKMEHMQEKINYFKKREDGLRREQKSLQKLIERKMEKEALRKEITILKRDERPARLNEAVEEIRKSSSQSW